MFATGYVESAGFFDADRERRLENPQMHVRLADALRRGRAVRDQVGVDLLEIDYHSLTNKPLDDVRYELGLLPKSDRARAAGSPGVFEDEGLTPHQLQYRASLN